MREVTIRFELPAGDPYRELGLTCRGDHLECVLVQNDDNAAGPVHYWAGLEGGLSVLLADALERNARQAMSEDRRELLAIAAALRRVNDAVCVG